MLFAYDNGIAELRIFPSGRDGVYEINDSVSALCKDYAVISIGQKAFAGCAALEGIVIPDSVTNIGEGAFEGSGITDVKADGNAVFAAVGGILYKYGESEGVATAKVIYNYTGADVPSSVDINGKQYTVNP